MKKYEIQYRIEPSEIRTAILESKFDLDDFCIELSFLRWIQITPTLRVKPECILSCKEITNDNT